MAASSLLALIDDIATLLDDVAVLTKVAAKQTTGVIGDDLALNAQQASGMSADREIPVVWAVAKGSLLNKVILVPTALVISAFAPAAILPLLMIGGLYLCYEGVEKVAHSMLHSAQDDAVRRHDLAEAISNPAVDVVAFERDKIKGAIRTDFILSAEIVVIALGTMSTAAFGQQVVALSTVAIAVTVLVYGLVAGIVKLDDLGLHMVRDAVPGGRRALRQHVGAMILRGAPMLMRTLSVLGTAAMFTVGGSIIAHGVPWLEHLIERLHTTLHGAGDLATGVVVMLAEAVLGVAAGAATLGLVMLGKKIRGAR